MKNNNIEFKAGYYEWNVFLKGEHFYSFGTSIDEQIEENTSYDELENIIEEHIECMQEDLIEHNKEPLDEKYIQELKEKMLFVWSWHYLDMEQAA